MVNICKIKSLYVKTCKTGIILLYINCEYCRSPLVYYRIHSTIKSDNCPSGISKGGKILRTFKYLLIVILLLTIPFSFQAEPVSAAGKTYTITPKSSPKNKSFKNYSTYNSSTKHYYLLRSYLEAFETSGGGTLVLSKGTYTITNTLYVPSNVTIRLKDGARLVKGTKTGTSKMKAAKSMFQLIRPTKANKSGVYGGYKGEKNISFIGEGKDAIIDLKYMKDSIAIIAGHNKNVTIKGITFKNMYSGHFIEMDATEKAVISGNTFMDSKASANKNKEAINLDTPDKTTKGWSQKWSKYDKTPNKDVTIEKNTFQNLDRAIGTHKYSGGKYHDRIAVKNNTIKKMRKDAIRVMNWSNTIITGNKIIDVDAKKNGLRGILVSGASNPTIKNNTFEKVARAMQFIPWKNDGPGSQYAVTYNKLKSQNLKDIANNKAKNTVEKFVRVNSIYNEYSKGTQKIMLK